MALAQLYREVGRQASLLSYVDVFWGLTLFVGGVAPLVLFLRTRPAQGEPG
jgi:hypothetical protein